MLAGLSPAQKREARLMYEDSGPDSLDAHVRRLLTAYGLAATSHHCDMRRSRGGLPDWVIVGRDVILFRELKSEYGQLQPAQRAWRDALVGAGANWAIWRPSDLLSGLIEYQLRILTGREFVREGR